MNAILQCIINNDCFVSFLNKHAVERTHGKNLRAAIFKPLCQANLKTGMDFWGQVWKRVEEMAFFGLKLGLDLEMRAADPHQKFQGVPPRDVAWSKYRD